MGRNYYGALNIYRLSLYAAFLVLHYVVASYTVCAQVSVSNSMSPSELAQHLIGGSIAPANPHLSISNVSYSGAADAIGSYTFGGGDIPLVNSGILLTTGSIYNAVGPNTLSDAGTDNGLPGDPALESYISSFLGHPMNSSDACVLEFDITPEFSVLRAHFVFASEEYNERIGTNHDDAFAVFISGPGITGNEDIAKNYHKQLPVTIGTISGYGNDQWHPYFGGSSMQYDGYYSRYASQWNVSSPWELEVRVWPCRTYHIKIVIADGGDGLYDSGVFIERGFHSIPGYSMLNLLAVQPKAIEGCRNAKVYFNRSGNFVQRYPRYLPDQTLKYTVSGTASPGLDFVPLSGILHFAEGTQISDTIFVEALNDGIPDDTEYLRIELLNDCDVPTGEYSIVTFYDLDSLSVDLRLIRGDSVACRGDTVLLRAQVRGFPGPEMSFEEDESWEWTPNYPARENLLAIVDTTTLFKVRYKLDYPYCGRIVSDSILIRIASPELDAGPDVRICVGDTAVIGAPAHGGSPPYSYEWTPTAGLSNPGAAMPLAAPSVSTSYKVKVTDTWGCPVYDSVMVLVSDIELSMPNDTVVCAENEFEIGATIRGGAAPYIFTWTPSDGLDDPTALRPRHVDSVSRIYTLTAMDGNGCTARDSIRIDINALLTVDAGEDIFMCKTGIARLNAQAKGGTPPYTYAWSPQTGLSSSVVADPIASISSTVSYTLVVTDSLGCSANDFITIKFGESLGVSAGPDTTICMGDSIRLHGTVSEGTPPYTFSWSPATGLSNPTSPDPVVSPSVSTEYILEVTDALGCTDTDSVFIAVSVPPDLKISLLTAPIVCEPGSWPLVASTGFEKYLWSNGDTTDFCYAHTPGMYGVTAITADGCVVHSDSIEVIIIDIPDVEIAGPKEVCVNSSAEYTLHPHPGEYITEWNVTGGGIVSETPASIRVQWTDMGLGRVDVTIFDSTRQCSKDSSLVVQVSTTLIPSIAVDGPLPRCTGDTVILSAGAGYKSYSWSNGATTPTIAVTAQGTFNVEVEDSTGCTGTSEDVVVTFVDPPEPYIIVHGKPVLCEGDSAVLQASMENVTYQWSTGDTTKSIQVRSTGTYTVTVTSPEGCKGTSPPESITVEAIPEPVITGPQLVCEGTIAQYSTHENAGNTYQWIVEGGIIQGNAARPQVAVRWDAPGNGRLLVVEESPAGCTGTSVWYDVSVHANPVVTISVSGDTLTASPFQSYQWYRDGTLLPGGTSQIYVAQQSGDYEVVVLDSIGCEGKSNIITIEGPDEAHQVAVVLPDVVAAPGDIVRIPAAVQSLSSGFTDDVHAYNGVLRVHKSLLFPYGNTPSGTVDGDTRIIPFTGSVIAAPSSLVEYDFVVMLGPLEQAPITIDTVSWDIPNVETSIRNGSITIDICREGGPRLWSDTGILRLAQNAPNPYNATTRITYELIEAGRAQLFIVDALGRRVATLFNEYKEPGVYEISFDAHHLSSGTYLYVLQTPTATLSRMMQVMK